MEEGCAIVGGRLSACKSCGFWMRLERSFTWIYVWRARGISQQCALCVIRFYVGGGALTRVHLLIANIVHLLVLVQELEYHNHTKSHTESQTHSQKTCTLTLSVDDDHFVQRS